MEVVDRHPLDTEGPGAAPEARRTAAVTRLFDRLSSIYDAALLQTVVYRPAQDEIVSVIRRLGAGRIADIGCGTGILAARIGTGLPGSTVIGCDLSDGMLGVARQRPAPVAWVRAPADALPLASGSLDAVVSSHAFHFFDQAAALAEFHRVLAPGGVAAVVIINPLTRGGTRLVQASIAGAGRFPDQRLMRRLFAEAGFESVEQRRVRRGGVRVLSPDLLTVGRRP